MTSASIRQKAWQQTARGSLLPLVTLAIVALMVVPVPSLVLDIGFIANIAISLAVLMIALNAARPLDFSSFPTVLLFATLLRLALNVASTRVVLVNGHTGAGAAGHVIEAFGKFLIGGDWAVGIFVFAIVMIINLVVITKGAGRVSEVSARFTLDALPGKQMAIDADLNAGLMTPEEAKLRRQDVATEADFYGSMDGASKFVKGDAVAGVLILVANIVGGIALGVAAHGLSLSEAASRYVLLAIGDALVAQVPALLLSIAAAAIVTRVTSPLDLAGQVSSQFGSAKAWTPVALILGFLGLLPGMPHAVMLPAALMAGGLSWKLRKVSEVPVVRLPEAPSSQINWTDVSHDAAITIDLGYGLVALVDERLGAPLMGRVTAIRRQLSRELGFVVPLVRVRDDMAMSAQRYRISIGGVIAGEDEVWPEDWLALDAGDVERTVTGRGVKDPTFGLDALWITQEQRAEAVACGYTVVDASTVVATHLNRLVGGAAADLFGIDEMHALLDMLKESAPQLVGALTPQPYSLAAITALCRALLTENVSLTDFRRVAGAMIEHAAHAADPRLLLEQVRQQIGSVIVQRVAPSTMPLAAISFAPELEAMLAEAVRLAPDALYPFEPGLSEKLIGQIASATQAMVREGRSFAIITGPAIRYALARMLRVPMPETPVLSYLELPATKAVTVVAVIGSQENAQALIPVVETGDR